MANPNSTKKLPKGSNPNQYQAGNATPGQEDISKVIKTTLEDFAIAQAMQMSAFFTGKGSDTKTSKEAQQKANNTQPSILGKSNSILNTLQTLRNSLKTSLSINGKALGGTIKSINDTIKNALYDKDISLMQALTGILSTKNESIVKFDEDQLNNLIKTLDDNRLNEVMQKVVDAENKADANLKMAQTYYESFNNTALKNESNIQKIIDAFTNSNQNLSNINEEIRKDNENKIVEAKLKLIIEGIDTSTIDALIKFSQLNLDKLEENSQGLINFFEALKVLENTKLNESLANLNMLGPILVGFMAQIKVVNLIGKIVKPKDINNFSTILNSFCKIFVALNNLSALSGKSNAKQILKTFGVLQETLGLLVYSIPLFLMVNTSYASENGNFGVNIGKTVEILTDISFLFQYIIDMPQLNNGGKLLKSFGILTETLGLLVYSIPLFIAINKMYASQNGNSGVNIGKTVEILTDLSVLFQKIIDMPQINNGGKLLKSFILLNMINTSLVSSIPSMMLVNQTLSNKDYIKRLQTIFEKIKPLFKAINEAKTIEQGKQLIKSFNQLDKINFGLNNSINEINEIFNNNDLNGDNLKKLKNLYKNEEESDIYSLFIILDSLNTIKNSSKIIQSFDDFNIINLRLETTLKNIQQLDIKSNKTKFETIIKSLDYISKIFNIINDIKALNNKTKEKIATIAGLFGSENDDINVSLMEIFKNINQMEFPEQSNLTTITNSINEIKTIVESLNALGLLAKNAKTIDKNLDEYIKLLEDTYTKIKDKFELIIATGDTAEKIKAANEKIGEALDSTNETIVKTSNNEKTIEKSVIAIEGITEFMIGAAAVMSIGALFVLLGGGKFIKAALQFGLALAVFEGLVLMPAIMFNSQKETALKGLEGFNSFVITCGLTMAIGALIFELGGGKFVKDALAFGFTLSIFEMLVIAPVLSFYVLKDKVLDAMTDFSKFVITCGLTMAIGAIIFGLGGGKFVKAALAFGVTLGIFEMLVVAPFILFSLVKDKVNDSVKDFTTLIITCAIIMSIGALFAQNENFKKGAYAFALLMMKFEVAVIAPFLLFDLLKKQVFDGLKAFSSVVIVCTTVLLIGAMFMHFGGGKFAKNAILFTGVLALFELLIIAPFILFNQVQTTVFGGLKNFAIVVFVSTTVLITGALFMTLGNGKYAIAAMEFAGLLMLFEAAVITPLLLFNLIKRDALNGARDFGAFVALCSFSLLIGSFFIKEFGIQPVKDFEGMLSWFVVKMTVMAVLMSIFGGEGTKAAKDFGIFILLCSAALIIGGIFMTIQNGKFAQGAQDFAILLGLFVVAMGGVMVALAWAFKASGGQEKIIAQMAAMGIFILSATVSLGLGAKIIDKYGMMTPLKFAAMLVGFVGLMGVVFGILGLPPLAELIGIGSGVALLMGVALLALSGSIMLINKLFEKDPKGQKTQKNIEALISVLDGTKKTFAKLGALGILIAPGAVVAAAIGASLLVLGGAFRVLDIIFGDEGQDIKGNIQFLNDLLKNDLMGTYTLLGLLSIPIAAGAIVATAIGASMLIVGGAFELINLMMGEHGEETKANILILDNILGEVGKTYTILGALSPLIALGSAAGTLMGISITIIGGALALVNKFIDPIKDNLEDNINKIDAAINSFGGITGTLLKWSIPLTLSLLALPQLVLFTTGVSGSIVAIRVAVDAIKKTGDISKYTQLMTSNIQNFIDIIDNVKDIGMLSGKKSKIKEIKSLVQPLGETLSQLAESVQSIASLKIPMEWDEKGNAIKYRNISEADFKLVNKNVNQILTSTASSFTLAWNMGLKNIANDKNGGFWKAMYFATNVGKILSGITDSVIKIGQSMMPDPTSWNPETGKFTKYQKINFDEASTNLSIVVSKVLFATADAFIRAYNGDGKTIGIKWLIFGDPKQSPFLQAVDGITKMTQTLSSITDSVIKIASAQIPNKWDKDGKVLSYEKISVDDAITNMRKVLIGNGQTPGIITTLIDVYNRAAFEILFNPFMNNDKNVKKINDNLNTIISLVSKSADLLVKISSLNIPTKFDKDGKGQEFVKLTPDDIDKAKANMIKILTNLISVFDSSDKENELNKYLTQVVVNPTNINKNIKSIESILPNITKQIQSLIDFNKQTQNIKISNNQDRITSISNLYDGIISIITTIYDKLHSKTSIESKNIGTLTIDISKITNAISTIFSSMGSIYDEFYKNVNKYKNNISNIIGQLSLSDDGLNVSVKNLKTNLDALKTLYTQEFSDINFDDKTVLDSLSTDLKSFIDNTITPFDNDIFTKATNLHTSINSIYSALAKQQDKSKEFNKNTNALQTYIKTINTVELDKLRPLTTLVVELNRLAGKLGNLDKLTSTISNELSEVLRDLVNSLTEAKTTINSAHQLQSDRAEQIQKSISKVRELINSPLNINVMANTNGNTPPPINEEEDDDSKKTNPTVPTVDNVNKLQNQNKSSKNNDTPNTRKRNNS